MGTTPVPVAPAATPVLVERATLDDLNLDAQSAREDRQLADARDESAAEALDRERAEKREAECRERLAGKHAVAVYRRLARRSRNLTDSEFRVLDTLLEFSSNLANCFPGRRALLAALGGRQRKVGRLDQIRQSLRRKRWVTCVPLAEGDPVAGGEDGLLRAANETGRFISAVGYVFGIPAGEITPTAAEWEGPRDFSNRSFGQRRKGRARRSD